MIEQKDNKKKKEKKKKEEVHLLPGGVAKKKKKKNHSAGSLNLKSFEKLVSCILKTTEGRKRETSALRAGVDGINL